MITIEIENQKVIDALNRLAKASTNLTPAMQEIGEVMTLSTKERFGKSQAPDGKPWAANSPLVARLKGHSKPLIGESKRLSYEINYNAKRQSVEIGSSLIYAAVQQFGASKGQFGKTKRNTPIPWKTIPARPFIGLSATDANHLTDILKEHLEAALAV